MLSLSNVWKLSFPVALFGVALASPTAVGFFPPVPPPSETVTVVPPIPPDPVVIPPVPPVSTPPQKPVEKPTEHHCGDPGTPQSVPEPATLIATAAGLASLAGWKLRRRG